MRSSNGSLEQLRKWQWATLWLMGSLVVLVGGLQGYSLLKQAAQRQMAQQQLQTMPVMMPQSSPQERERRAAVSPSYAPPRGFSPPRIEPGNLEELRLREMAAKLRSVPEEERSNENLDKLRELLTAEFERRHTRQQQRLEQILAEAKETQAALEKREAQKEEIVERRLSELLGERDPLDWNYQPGGQLDEQLAQNLPQIYRPATPRAPGYEPGLPGMERKGPRPPRPGEEPRFPRADAPEGRPELPADPGLPGRREPGPGGFPPGPQRREGGPAAQNVPLGSRDVPAPRTDWQPPAEAGSTPAGRRSDPFGSSTTYRVGPPGPDAFPVRTPAGEPKTFPESNISEQFIRAGYRLKQLREAVRQEEALGYVVNPRKLAEEKIALEEAKAVWEYLKQEIRRQLKAAEMRTKAAGAKYDADLSLYQRGALKYGDLQQSRTEASLAILAMDQLQEQLTWMDAFEESQSEGKEEAESDAAEEEEQEEPSAESEEDVSDDENEEAAADDDAQDREA